MSFTSYAPDFEDVTLWRALAPLVDGVYVDIDTASPTAGSVSRAFQERGWKGVHVIADSSALAGMDRARDADLVIEARIGSPAPVAPQAGPAVLSIAPSIVSTEDDAGPDRLPGNAAPILTLDALFARIGAATIHWMRLVLQDDANAVFDGWRDSASRPWILLVKHGDAACATGQSPDWEPYLIAKGYRHACSDGSNRYYVLAAHSLLAQRLKGMHALEQAADPAGERAVHALQRKLFDAQAALLSSEERTAKAELELRSAFAEAQQVAVLQRQLHDVYASTSWQITTPMRWVSRLRRSPRSALAELGGKAAGIARRVRNMLLNHAINLVLTRPRLKRMAVRVAHRFPGLLQRFKPQIKVVMSAAPAPGPSNPATVIGPRFRSLILDELQRPEHP